MPKATRFSPSYERRRSAQYASRSSSESSSVDAPSPPSTLASPPPSTSTSRSSSKHSMGYIRGRISSGLHSPATATATSPVGIASESYLRIKKKGALTTWSTRFLVLRGSQLVWFSNKQDAQWRRGMLEMQYVEHGTLTTLRSNELGLAIKTTDGKEYVARAFDRGDLAKWITAFQRLALKREAKRLSSGRRLSETLTADSTETAASDPLDDEVQHRRPEPVPHAVVDKGVDGARHVSFHNSVLVRMIPTVTDDQIPELFYSREDMEKFSARASSLLCRTEEAVSCAVLAIRRPSSISCKGTELSLCRREMEIA